MVLDSILLELIVCTCLRVKSFEVASKMFFFGEEIPLVDSRFDFEVMSADWPVNPNFRSVFFPALRFF